MPKPFDSMEILATKPKDEKPDQTEMVALRNKAREMGMKNADATQLFVSSKTREKVGEDMKEFTKGNRPTKAIGEEKIK